jgi:cation transport regulator ChaC
MKSGEFNDENFDGLADALGGLLKGLGETLGLEGVTYILPRNKASSSRTCLVIREVSKI